MHLSPNVLLTPKIKTSESCFIQNPDAFLHPNADTPYIHDAEFVPLLAEASYNPHSDTVKIHHTQPELLPLDFQNPYKDNHQTISFHTKSVLNPMSSLQYTGSHLYHTDF